MTALELRRASATLGGRRVLMDIQLSVSPGEVVALVGPNGAGKSSVIRALASLLSLEDGSALLGGTEAHTLSPRARSERVGYLPQERRIAWNLPAVEVAALGAPFLDAERALERARAALETVEAGHLATRGVAEMSGGERGRVLLARALATEARALLVDEPIAGLDPDAQLMVLDLLRARATTGQAVLVSLHDLQLAARTADRVVVMQAGRIVADGAPLDALTPAVLAEVFGLNARWVHSPEGPLLAAGRQLPGSDGGVVRPVSPGASL